MRPAHVSRGNELTKTPAKRRPRASQSEDGTLTDRAYRELEEMIVTLQLSPGTVLSEQALSARLKIGRTPIRAAIDGTDERAVAPVLVSALPAGRGPAACRQAARRSRERGGAEKVKGGGGRVGPPDRLHRGFRAQDTRFLSAVNQRR